MNYRFHAGIIKRTPEHQRRAISAAAYRAGQDLYDDGEQKTHRYSYRNDIIHSTIMAPDKSPSWVYDREVLWNHVESTEKQKNSQLAREMQITLDGRISDQESIEMVERLIQENFISKGMIADFSIHRKKDNSQTEVTNNIHVHIMLTMRKLEEVHNEEGTLVSHTFSKTKATEWNDVKELNRWKENWEKIFNEVKDKHGFNPSSALSHEDRGISDKLEPIQTEGPEPVQRDKKPLKDSIQRREEKRKRIQKINNEIREKNKENFLTAISITNPLFTREDVENALFVLLAGGSTTNIHAGHKPEQIKKDVSFTAKDRKYVQTKIKELENNGSIIPIETNDGDFMGYTTPDIIEQETEILDLARALTQQKQKPPLHKRAKTEHTIDNTSAAFAQAAMTRISTSPLSLINDADRTQQNDPIKIIQRTYENAGYQVIGITPEMEEADQRKEQGTYEECFGVRSFLTSYRQTYENGIKLKRKKRKHKGERLGEKIDIKEKSIMIIEESSRLSAEQIKRLLKIAKEQNSKLLMLNNTNHKKAFCDHRGIFNLLAEQIGTLTLSGQTPGKPEIRDLAATSSWITFKEQYLMPQSTKEATIEETLQ